MLTYNRALDPYHSAFRILEIVRYVERRYSLDLLRILDFYLTFPAFIEDMRFPSHLMRWKRRFREERNPYHYPTNPVAVFKQMHALQDGAVRRLLAKELLNVNAAREDQSVVRVARPLPPILEERIRIRTEEQDELLGFLTGPMAEIPLQGRDGLKHRTGLLEHRYDVV